MGKNTNPSPTYPQFPGGAAVVVPSDTVNLPYVAVLYVGGTGNVTLVTANGDVVLFTAVPAGAIIPVQVSRVNLTGTTATAMVAIY